MHNDDNVYRKHTFPSVARCIEGFKNKKQLNPNIFKSAVEESYKKYIRKFPIRQLSDSLDEEQCLEVCKKLHDDLRKDYDDGKYKD